MSFRFIPFLLICFIAFSMHAQEPTSINYTTKEGLSSNEVYGLLEDKDGYIWIGTDKGACRFNSSSFQCFTQSDGLADSDVLSIHQDSKGYVWFLPYNGKLSYWKNGIIYNSTTDHRLLKTESEFFFHSFLEDHLGNLWFATQKEGLYKIDTLGRVDKIKCPDFIKTSRSEVLGIDSNNYTIQYLFESKGSIIYGAGSSLYKYDGKQLNLDFKYKEYWKIRSPRHGFNRQKNILYTAYNNYIEAISVDEKKEIWSLTVDSVIRINKLALLKDSLLYAATDKGLYSFNQKGEFRNKLLNGESISDMLIDREGNLWVSTLNKGIFYFRNLKINNYSTDVKYAILPIQDDSIIFAGTAYNLHSIANKQIKHLPIQYNKTDLISKKDYFLSLSKNDLGEIWLGNQKGLYFLNQNTAKIAYYSKINDILPFKEYLFLASYYSCLKLDLNQLHKEINTLMNLENTDAISNRTFELDNSFRVHNKMSYCFSNVVDDRFYMGSIDGLYQYSNSDEAFRKVLSIQNITKIKQTAEQNLWILKKNSGLFYLNTNTKKLSTIELPVEISGAFYTSLEIDKDGNPWVGSNKGVFSVKVLDSNYQIKHYNRKNGLPSNEINDIKIVSGDIWMATSEGISCLPKISLIDTIPPLLFIDSIIAGGTTMNQFDSIYLFDDNNSLSIHYTGISYKDLGEINFEYELKGKSTLSTNTTTDREFLLTNLNPSNYSLSIAAIDTFGNKSKAEEINFTVMLPWWKNWKYWLLILILVLIIIVISIRIFFQKSYKEIYQLLTDQIPFIEKQRFITVKSVATGGMEKISLNKLLYIEATGNYMEFFLPNKKVLARTTLKTLNEELAEETDFLKVHKSYIVNLKKVDSFQTDHLKIMGKEIPIARNKKTAIKQYISSL